MKRILIALVCVVLLLALATSVLCAAAADGGYDFSHAGSPIHTTLTPSDIATLYLERGGITLQENEGEFLNSYSDLSLTVSTVIPNDAIGLSYDSDTGTLTVSCEEYCYLGNDGELTWYPYSICFGGTDYPLADGERSLALSGVAPEKSGDEVTVRFRAETEISEGDIDALINLYYLTAKYSYEREQYAVLLSAYEAYLGEMRLYGDKVQRYEEYMRALDEYNETLYEYENYELLMKEYEAELALYLSYLQAYYEYETEYSEYLKYKTAVDRVARQLLPLELIKEKMRDGRDLYTVIFGSTVDSVIENKALITSSIVGVDPAVVDLAGDATSRVRAHITSYFNKEQPEDRYEYYRANYKALCTDFRELTASLDKLYQNPRVRGILIAEDKARKYCILLAQLALITDALIDGEVYDLDGNPSFDESYTLEGTRRDDILGAVYLNDNDAATPIDEGIPPYLAVPTPPEAVPEPARPVRPKAPTKPDEPPLPGPVPRPIVNPTPPVASDAVREVYGELTDEKRTALADAYAGGTLSPREAGTLTVTHRSELCDSLTAQRVRVTFTDSGGELLYEATVRAGGDCIYEGVIPQRAPDAENAYLFAGWQDSEGNSVSLSSISTDTTLTPVFLAEARSYSVSWHFADRVIITQHRAGEIPTPPDAPTPPDEGSLMLVHTGYDKELTPVFADTSYTALYDKCYIVPAGGGGGDISTVDGNTSLDLFGYGDRSFYIEALLERIAGKTSLSVYTTDAEISFTYTDVIKMKAAGVTHLSPLILRQGEGAYSYRIGLLLGDGNAAVCEAAPSVSLPASLASYDSVSLYTEKSGAREYVGYKFSSSKCAFLAEANTLYTLASEYRLSSFLSEGAELDSIPSVVRPGERVLVRASAAEGYTVSETLVTDSLGNRLQIDSGGYIVMPYSDVTVRVVTKPVYYTVSFTLDGVTLATRRVRYGEVPTPPAVADRRGDGGTVRFLCWDRELSPAYSDASYTARTSLTVDTQDGTDGTMPEAESDERVVGEIVAVVSVIAVLLVLAIIIKRRCD